MDYSGYLTPVRYPCFRVSASVADQVAAFATGVLPYIYAFHRYTWSSTTLFCTKLSSFRCTSPVKPKAFTSDLENRLALSLRPINPDTACHLRITAAAGT